MELKNQVVNLELSKKLKELGVKQESYFWWVKSPYFGSHWTLQPIKSSGWISTPAYTVAELGEMLPFGTKSIHIDAWDDTYQGGKNWMCNAPERKKRHIEYADTEANARAKMVIYAKENNLLED